MKELDQERIPNYYEELGWGHDAALRCKDCRSIVTFTTIQRLGCCDRCGNKRFSEISVLTEQEMADVQSGKIDFPNRDKFLAEFHSVE